MDKKSDYLDRMIAFAGDVILFVEKVEFNLKLRLELKLKLMITQFRS